MACEGFAKLLLNNCRLENKTKILTNLLIVYLTSSNTSNSNKKLLACLCSFFDHFKQQDAVSLIQSYLPSLRFLTLKQKGLQILKKCANFFYFITNDTISMRQILILQTIEEILRNFNDFYFVQRMIEVLLEFNVHQCDIDRSPVNIHNPKDAVLENSIKVLTEIATQLQNILVCVIFATI